MVLPRAVMHYLFQRVRERGMPDIVEHRRREERFPLALREIERAAHEPGHMIGPQRMLEPGMVRSGKDQAGQAELADPVHPLQLGTFQQF